MTVDVTSVNDAPQGADNTVSTDEDTAYTFAPGDFGFSDPNDSPANHLASVKVTSLSLPAGSSLKDDGTPVAAGDEIPVADISGGKLKFTPAPNDNGAGYATFNFKVRDDGGTANSGVDLAVSANTMTVDVTSVNDAPQGADNTVSTNEDTAYTFAPGDFGFSDPNDSPANHLASVKVTSLSLPAGSSLKDDGTPVAAGDEIPVADISGGKLKFTPAPNDNGAGYATFNFKVRDDGGTANSGVDLAVSANTMTVDVTSVNDAPQGADNTVSTNEDTAYTFAPGDFGFSDPNDSPANHLASVKVTSLSLPAGSSLKDDGTPVAAGDEIPVADISGGKLKFTPAPNDNGAGYATFNFKVRDDGGTANSGVDLAVSANTMTVDVTSVNDAPQGADNTVSTNEDTAYTFDPGDFGICDPNDSPANHLASVKVTSLSLPAGSSLKDDGTPVAAGDEIPVADISGGKLKFTPAPNDNGAGYATFNFKVRDDGGTANSGVDLAVSANTMTVDVTSVNDAPQGADNTVSTNEDTAYTFDPGDFGICDPNDSPANHLASVKVTSLSLPAGSSLKDDGTPVAAGDEIPVADISGGKLKFTPAPNDNGAGYATFNFKVRDDGGTANSGVDLAVSANTMTVDVTSVNDAPQGADNTVSTNEDTAYTFAPGDFGFSDPNDSPANHLASVKVTSLSLPAGSSLKDDGAAVAAGDEIPVADISGGKLKFTPAPNANGTGYATFNFKVRDDGGTANFGVDLAAAANTMTVDVNSVNDKPTADDKTVSTNEDTAKTVTLSGSDVESCNLTFTIVSGPSHGTLSAISPNACVSGAPNTDSAGVTYTPDADFNGPDSFTYKVTDTGDPAGCSGPGCDAAKDSDTATVSVTVTEVNDPPVAHAD